jgi:hypothetical protein
MRTRSWFRKNTKYLSLTSTKDSNHKTASIKCFKKKKKPKNVKTRLTNKNIKTISSKREKSYNQHKQINLSSISSTKSIKELHVDYTLLITNNIALECEIWIKENWNIPTLPIKCMKRNPALFDEKSNVHERFKSSLSNSYITLLDGTYVFGWHGTNMVISF